MIKGEEGQSLPGALLILGVGSLLLLPFLTLTGNALNASGKFAGFRYEQYAADAGAEDAIWRLRYGGLTTTLLTLPGFTTTYPLSQTLNGVSASVTVTMQRTTVAQDDFESGGWSGGTGWLAAWTNTGDSSNTPSGSPHGGSRHVRLRLGTGYIERRLNLSGWTDVRLQFWAKVSGFTGADSASLKVGPTGSLSTAKTWTSADADDTYHACDVDLSTYTMAPSFSIAYATNVRSPANPFYVDDIFVGRVRYDVTVTAGATTLSAQVTTRDTQVVIYSWTYS